MPQRPPAGTRPNTGRMLMGVGSWRCKIAETAILSCRKGLVAILRYPVFSRVRVGGRLAAAGCPPAALSGYGNPATHLHYIPPPCYTIW